MAMQRLTQDFKEFLQLLNSEKIEYLLIGGYAVGLYGHVRGTKDMDVWVATTPENLDRLVDALVKFGFTGGSISRRTFDGPQTVFRMGMPPNRLELLTRIDGVAFTECYTRRSVVDCDGIPVSLISYDDLKRNKLASGRAADVADVEALEKSRARKSKG